MNSTLRSEVTVLLWSSALALVAGTAVVAEAKKCSADSVQVGPVCVDKYEASVWSTTDATLIKNIRKGKIDEVADLAGATQHGVASDDFGAGCPDTGNGCMDYYAVSLAGVAPSGFSTWFQAAAACRNAGKRLATNQEWQMAALGTPDPGTDNGTTDCNVDSGLVASNTGSRISCESDAGAFDTVGNLEEWVADWGGQGSIFDCVAWDSAFGDDDSCVGSGGASGLTGTLIRGGNLSNGAGAGVFNVITVANPTAISSAIGFRCAR